MRVPVSLMLRYLEVRHLAVIEHLALDFAPGLNLLTGETGAGKSVMVEAIDLLLGGRASADMVRTGEDTASVQAVFERADGTEVIVRRDVSAQGRSRAFIDGALTTTQALRDLGRSLVDLHGQHEHQTLLDPAGHRQVLDGRLADQTLAPMVSERFETWRQLVTDLGRSRLDDREKRARLDVARFQKNEIDTVHPVAGEDESLEAERNVLANADRLRRLSDDAYGALYDGEHAALPSLAIVWKRLGDLVELDNRFAPHLEARDAVKAALEDLALTLRDYRESLNASPDRLEAVEQRRAALDRLTRKYGPSLSDVLAKQVALTHEIAALDASDERIAALEREELAARDTYRAAADRLTAARLAAGRQLAADLSRLLADLAMPHAKVEVRVAPETDPALWTAAGQDRVEFFLSPNPGEDSRPLARIASGGELSRIMLALHTLAAATEAGKTLVFDEVDAGIGGAAADAVGRRLQDLGRRYQVLCITHLPQVAARAGTHFHIAKRVHAGRTSTSVTRLDADGRELELARMLAGDRVSAGVLASAREMIATRSESEQTAKGESRRPGKAKGPGRGA